ncbi:MAG: GNAT family N-acetyltransferase [Betaproteobacteria bacterium]|nr:GNAT family N-acetyltransferase [Betaproteobacteria bacterium]
MSSAVYERYSQTVCRQITSVLIISPETYVNHIAPFKPEGSMIIRKAARVVGKSLFFRNATVADAEFILSLRTDREKSRYLSFVSGKLADQQAWMECYAKAEDQAYFIIMNQDDPIGTIRLYDPQGDSFCWGSWILKNGRPSHAAMESVLMLYAYATDHLGFTAAHFDVRKGNERVWQFHERFGAKRVSETEIDYFYELDNDAILTSRKRYSCFLEGSVRVEFL